MSPLENAPFSDAQISHAAMDLVDMLAGFNLLSATPEPMYGTDEWGRFEDQRYALSDNIDALIRILMEVRDLL